MEALREFYRALRDFVHNPTPLRLVAVVAAAFFLLAVVVSALSVLTGQNVAVELAKRMAPWLSQSSVVPNRITAIVSAIFIALAVYAAVLILFLRSSGRKLAVASDVTLALQQRETGLQAGLEAEKKKTAILGHTLERLERTTLAIVETAQQLIAQEQVMLLGLPLSEQERTANVGRLKQLIDDSLSSGLGSAIVYAQGLFGPSVYRGGILVPPAPDSPVLVHLADDGWNEQEKLLRFYIRLHPRNTDGRKSVAGAAFWDKSPQVCRWDSQRGAFDHSDYLAPRIYPTGAEPHKSFVALPLGAEFLRLDEEPDKHVLGVLCLDATDPHIFDGHPLLDNLSTGDAPVICIMRVMFYLLRWRERAFSSLSGQ